MTKTLRATKPAAIEKRLKMLVYGPAGVGKTMAAIAFPRAYIIDTEHGSDYYSQTINASGSVVLQTNDVDEIKEELHSLLTLKHEYKTLIIDPITQIYNACQEKWTRIFEKHATNEKTLETQDFGPRFWGKVKQDMKEMDRLILAQDMNVIVTSHQKDIYGPNMVKLGVGPDTKKGDEYIFDLVFELTNIGAKRMAVTKKERAEIGKQKFPPEFEWSYGNFLAFYGTDIISREAKPISLARPADVEELNKLLEVVKIEDNLILKWFDKADVSSFDQMTEEQIQGCIKYCHKKLDELNKNVGNTI